MRQGRERSQYRMCYEALKDTGAPSPWKRPGDSTGYASALSQPIGKGAGLPFTHQLLTHHCLMAAQFQGQEVPRTSVLHCAWAEHAASQNPEGHGPSAYNGKNQGNTGRAPTTLCYLPSLSLPHRGQGQLSKVQI